MNKMLARLTAVCALTLFTMAAHANPIEDVQVKAVPDGYVVSINFLSYQMRFRNATGDNPGDEARVFMQLANNTALSPDQLLDLTHSQVANWDKAVGVPLEEIVFEGGSDTDNDEINIKFTHPVRYEIKNSTDMRSLIIRIYTQASAGAPAALDVKPAASPAADLAATKPEVVGNELPEDLKDPTLSKADAAALANAKHEMLNKHYVLAIVLYTKLVDTGMGNAKMQAQEFLGVAREKVGQFEHARQEYEKYLKLYPTSPYAERVRQRLEGVMTATQAPRERLRETVEQGPASVGTPRGRASMSAGPSTGPTKPQGWVSNFSGSFMQLYNYDTTQTITSNTTTNSVVRNDITSFLDLNESARNGVYEVKSRLSGSERTPFASTEHPQGTLSTAFEEVQDKEIGVLERMGRQSASSGGVLGRFDGIYMSYKVLDNVKANLVGGLPVASSHAEPNVNGQFVGANVDVAALDKKLNFNFFGITQYNKGFVDRRAVGGEVRTFSERYSFFTLMDYDVYYNALNIVMSNAQYNFKEINTSLYGTYDYRKSPTMMTQNALQGQTYSSLRELNQYISTEDMKRLAAERTSLVQTGTIGFTHDVNPDFQVNPEIVVTHTGGTVASPAIEPTQPVEATPAIGYEFNYGLQFINSNIWKAGDNFMTSFRYGDMHDGRDYTLTLSANYPYTEELRISPQVRAEYYETGLNEGVRWRLRPDLKMEYRMRRYLSLQAEGGLEYTDDHTQGAPSKGIDVFGTTGFRLSF